jgi:hypothetical protein
VHMVYELAFIFLPIVRYCCIFLSCAYAH